MRGGEVSASEGGWERAAERVIGKREVSFLLRMGGMKKRVGFIPLLLLLFLIKGSK